MSSEALRVLLLPIPAGVESACQEAFQNEMSKLGVSSDDYLTWVALELANWEASRSPSSALKSVVRNIIRAACEGDSSEKKQQGYRLSDGYFDLHRKLVEQHLLSHDQAVAFLTHSFLIAHLAYVESLSAAQIARLLAERDRRADFSRQAVVSALQTLGLEPELSLEKLQALYRKDAAEEPLLLADADFESVVELVSVKAMQLGFSGDALKNLKILTPRILEGVLDSQFTPYLQILHYQCSIAEFFDHAIMDVYEFSPRGVNSWLYNQYPHSIAGAGNPFLNNAKSVEICDKSWARAKKQKERPGAMALVSILEGMQEMGFSARRELARWIRLWLHRVIRVAGGVVSSVPDSLDDQQIARIIDAVASGNTQTVGIIEQRLVDAIGVVRHSSPTWRSRGVGDSVNATNVSAAKFGDCEFLNSESKFLIAYEAHGGVLTDVYVNAHIASLKKSLRRRVDELQAIADLSSWSVEIIFIAHDVHGDIPSAFELHGLQIKIKSVCFSEFLVEYRVVSVALVNSVNKCLMVPLKEQRTPNRVRDRLLEIVSDV